MTTQQDAEKGDAGPERGAADTRLPVLGLIDSLERACGTGVSPEEFVRQLTVAFVGLSEAVYGGFWRADPEKGEVVPVAELSPRVSEGAARQWHPALSELAGGVMEQGIIRYRSVTEPADPVLTGQSYMALGFPVRGQEEVSGCVTLVLERESGVLSGAGIALLRLLAEFGLLYGSSRSAARFERFYKSLSGAWDTVGELLAFTKPQEMAQVLVDRTRSSFEARRVSVGFVHGEKVKVAAISGEDIIDRRSNIARAIEAAQREVVISGEPGLFLGSAEPEERALQVTRNPQQERLARSNDSTAVYSVPLRKEDELVAVWTFEFGEDQFEEELRRVIDVTAGQVGPLLHLARQNSRGPFRRTRDALAAAARWVFGREHPWRKAAVVAAVCVLAFAIFGRTDFNVTGSCRLIPSFRRVYAAPFNTTIQAAPVRPGDTVAEGDLIVRFDRQDLELSLREAMSKRTSVAKEMSTYLVQEEKVPQYAEARARLEALDAEIELLKRRLERTDVRAEFPGIVIEGDLSQDIGRPVQMGEK
ncbi:MAG: hypothetical protein PVJ27_11690, partial [Candidatus Brocadiaceae bacterium]